MVPADRVLAALHGWLAPLPPEGASAIVYRDIDHAPELAAAQGVRSADLLRDGIVDVVVPEHPDAADEPVEFTKRLSATIAGELHRLRAIPDEQRLDSAAGPLPPHRPTRRLSADAIPVGLIALALPRLRNHSTATAISTSTIDSSRRRAS